MGDDCGICQQLCPKKAISSGGEGGIMKNRDQGKLDILMVGVGGQGIILASDILGDVALDIGLDVKKTDTLGMAQRGGSVTSHLRIGQKVWSPLINASEADILMAFEKLEAARWVNQLKPGGTVIINNLAIPPLSISLGTQVYPSDEAILDSFRSVTDAVHLVDGTERVDGLGGYPHSEYLHARDIYRASCP